MVALAVVHFSFFFCVDVAGCRVSASSAAFTRVSGARHSQLTSRGVETHIVISRYREQEGTYRHLYCFFFFFFPSFFSFYLFYFKKKFPFYFLPLLNQAGQRVCHILRVTILK